MAVMRWYRSEVTGASAGRLRWYRSEATGTAAVLLQPLQPQTVEPKTTVTLIATLAGGAIPDSYTWRRVSGPAITLVATGPVASFTAPSAMPPGGTSVVIGVTATTGSTTSPEQTVNITVLPQLRWVYTGGVWVGNRRPVLAGTMPTIETLPGFQWIYGENFNTDVASIANVTSGSDLGYVTGPYAASFKTKQENSATGEASGCRYSTVRTTSVVNGIFRCWMHYEGGVPYSGAIKPLLPGVNPVDQLYGRYRYRMRATGNDVGWGSVVDLITPGTWSTGTGEYGHPEVNHVTSLLGSYIRRSDHVADPNRQSNKFVYRRNLSSFGAPAGLNDWHEYEIRWQPGLIQLYIDDTVIWEDAQYAPTDALGFLMQCGAPGTPSSTSEALVEIDWITISKWVGP